MAIVRDLCIELSKSQDYITLSNAECPFQINNARDSLTSHIDAIITDQYSKVLGVNLRGINMKDVLPPEIEEEINARIGYMSDKQNLGAFGHMLDFSSALDRNIAKYMPALQETYVILNKNLVIL